MDNLERTGEARKFWTEIKVTERITYDLLDRNILVQRPAIAVGLRTSLQRRGPGIISMCYHDEIDIITWYAWGHIRLDVPAEITKAIMVRWNWALWSIAEIHEDHRMHNGYSVTLAHEGPTTLVDTNGFIRGMILGYDKRVNQHTKVLDSLTIAKLIEDNILPESARMRFDA